MAKLRSQYIPREKFVDEYNSGIQLTMPDMSKSVMEIIELSMSGQDPMTEYVPDRPYGQDLTDMLPNVDELGVLGGKTLNLSKLKQDVKDDTAMRDERDSDAPSVSEKQEE